MTQSLEELANRYDEFVTKRNWERFQTPQNLAMAVSVESNELLETFLWFNNPDAEKIQADEDLMGAVEEELADVIIYSLGLASQLDIDLERAVTAKLDENEDRFDSETTERISKRLDEWQ